MKLEINIDAVVAEAITKALDPARLAEKIGEQVTSTVDSVVREQFRSYGAFGDSVKAAVAEVVPHSVSIDGAAKFRDSIAKIVAERVRLYRDEALERHLDGLLGDLLTPPPKSITLSELIGDAVEQWHDHHERKEDSARPSIHVERTTGLCAGYIHIYMDINQRKDKYSCSTQIDVDPDGRVYGLKIDGVQTGRSLLVGPMRGFDRRLLSLYSGGTRIVVDTLDFSGVYYPETESEDD